MNLRKYGVAAFLLVTAFSVGRFSAPTKTEVREVVRTDEQTNTVTDRNQNVVEIIREILQPDGTRITETTKQKETSVQTERQRNSSTQRESVTTVEVRPSFRVGGIYRPAIRGFQEDGYGLILEKRIYSEFYFGILAQSDKTVAVTLSLGF